MQSLMVLAGGVGIHFPRDESRGYKYATPRIAGHAIRGFFKLTKSLFQGICRGASLVRRDSKILPAKKN